MKRPTLFQVIFTTLIAGAASAIAVYAWAQPPRGEGERPPGRRPPFAEGGSPQWVLAGRLNELERKMDVILEEIRALRHELQQRPHPPGPPHFVPPRGGPRGQQGPPDARRGPGPRPPLERGPDAEPPGRRRPPPDRGEGRGPRADGEARPDTSPVPPVRRPQGDETQPRRRRPANEPE